MYTIDFSVRLSDTDAAGILFFGNYFKIAHEAYEIFMESIDFSLAYVLDKAEALVLIVHAESEYKNSFKLGERFNIELNVDKIGKTSFTLSYRFISSNKKLMAEIKTVHVAVDKVKNRPVKLPERLKKELQKNLSPVD